MNNTTCVRLFRMTLKAVRQNDDPPDMHTNRSCVLMGFIFGKRGLPFEVLVFCRLQNINSCFAVGTIGHPRGFIANLFNAKHSH